jgi:hypothetical protein
MTQQSQTLARATDLQLWQYGSPLDKPARTLPLGRLLH